MFCVYNFVLGAIHSYPSLHLALGLIELHVAACFVVLAFKAEKHSCKNFKDYWAFVFCGIQNACPTKMPTF